MIRRLLLQLFGGSGGLSRPFLSGVTEGLLALFLYRSEADRFQNDVLMALALALAKAEPQIQCELPPREEVNGYFWVAQSDGASVWAGGGKVSDRWGEAA